ncbi:DNA repair protein XRCC3 homolog [Nephila pilipes]|uniref:DNA repair protein XRCC3 homolog n=1 Tax=Nephila pilipes TaxID=299642 RepID=A0A8X6TKD8_NEPPI|nr:DNA repair protein XRCC3 homolog [Nephila pilipes]
MDSSAPLKKKQKISVEIDDLSLHPQIIHKLKIAQLCSYKAILHLSQQELQKIAKVSLTESKIIIDTVSEASVKNKIMSVFDILCEDKMISRQKLTCNLLKNSSGNNCIYTGTITEICGESGSGKTQLCLYLSICAQKPNNTGGLNSKVIYIHSEGDFPIKRYLQMVNALKAKNPNLQNSKFSDNLILKKVLNVNQLIYVLQKGLPDLLKVSNSPKMLVIDSVAALLRSEYDSWEERLSLLLKLANEIWRLANVFGMAVICVNQVSGSNRSNQVKGLDIPSLGLLWSNILTTRLKVSRKPSEITGPTTRALELIFSSYHQHVCNTFIISENGIEFL